MGRHAERSPRAVARAQARLTRSNAKPILKSYGRKSKSSLPARGLLLAGMA